MHGQAGVNRQEEDGIGGVEHFQSGDEAVWRHVAKRGMTPAAQRLGPRHAPCQHYLCTMRP